MKVLIPITLFLIVVTCYQDGVIAKQKALIQTMLQNVDCNGRR